MQRNWNLVNLYQKKPLPLPSRSKAVKFKYESQLFSHVIQQIKKFSNYSQLDEFLDQIKHDISLFPNSCLVLLSRWKSGNLNGSANYELLNLIFEDSFNGNHDFNQLYFEKSMKLYLYIFQINRLPLNIIYLNLMWSKYGNLKLHDTYVLTYLLNLFNSDQKEKTINQLVEYLRVEGGNSKVFLKELPGEFILYMLETRDFARLHFLISRFISNGVPMENHLWVSVLQKGLQFNNYEIVSQVYKNYIMKDFSSGRFTIEDAVLNQKTVHDNSVFLTFTDTLISQILHTISMNGDTEGAEDLIKGHYIYKSLSTENKALNKDLCISLIESYCYNVEKDDAGISTHEDDSVKKILDLINTFVNQANISSVDLFECMNYKFKNWKVEAKAIDSNKTFIHGEEDEDIITLYHGNTNANNSKQGVVLADLSNLNEFINIHVNYLNENKFDIKTQTIFINCLLHHMVAFLNHTGLVSVLQNFHYISGNKFVDYLNDTSWKLILESVSSSTSRKCARFYFDYMKSHGIEITPEFYYYLIKASFNGRNYLEDVVFYAHKCMKDHGKLNRETQRILDLIIGNDVALRKKIAKLINNSEEIIPVISERGPIIERRYLEHYDLIDLEKLQKIFSK